MPSQPGSSDAAQQSSQLTTVPGSSYPVRSQPSSTPSSQQVSPPLTKDQQEVLQAVQKSLPVTATATVAVAIPGDGIF